MIVAHGIGGRTDLPIPLPALLIGAGVVLVITFTALALLWPHPKLQSRPDYSSPTAIRLPRVVAATVGFVALVLVVGQVLVGLVGAEVDRSRPSIAPVTVWVIFWLVVPFLGAFVGNWYADLNPWRAMASWFGIGRAERIGLPHKVGLWPASLMLIGFVWLELISPDSGDPATLGVAALTYTVFLLTAMSLVGRETGLAVFDAFTPYNRLFSAISPLGRIREGRLVWRGWLRSLSAIPPWPGLWFFVVVMVATVSYDGVSETAWFESITGSLTRSTSGRTVLLLLTVSVVAGAYLGVSHLAAHMSGGRWTAVAVAQRFAHTLVPIALAYALSHYFTLILFEGQQLLAAISDPFSLGWDLFGTADRPVSYFITSSTPIWITQVVMVVGGHLLGVVLAHDRALADFGRDAVRSQYAMLGLMIALTSLGLVILSG